MKPLFLTETQELSDYLDRFKDRTTVALDVEFVRQTTYYPELCLIQLAFAGEDPVIVDPLACDVSPLIPLLTNPNVIKIVHDGKQDVEALRYALSVIPAPLFDVQLAAAFCGMGLQLRYEKLVTQVCQSSFGQMKTPLDWKRRPLPESYLRYAAEDVHYLHDLYNRLTEKLDQLGRLAWFDQDMADISASLCAPPRDFDIGMRFKLGNLPVAHHANARTLAVIRDRIARHTNKVRRHLLTDEALLAASPNKEAAAKIFSNYPEFWADQADLQGLFMPPPRINPLEEDAEAIRLMLFAAVTKDTSQKRGLPEALITTRDTLRFFGASPTPLDQGWRHEVLGSLLKNIADGQLSVRLVGNALVYADA